VSRERATRFFLWVSVIAWGVLLGAKLFDLRVLVGAWSASPPESLDLLPYGPRFPVDTGDFFIPSSAALLLATLGATISGWRTKSWYRNLLVLSTAAIFVTLIFTVVAFWPRNAALWAYASGATDAIRDSNAIIAMVRQWVLFDWLRIAVASVGYVASIRALSVPFPAVESVSIPWAMKVVYGVCVAAVVVFAIYFVSAVL